MLRRCQYLPVAVAALLLLSVAGAQAGEKRFPQARDRTPRHFARTGTYLGLSGSYATDMALEGELESMWTALGFTSGGVNVGDSFALGFRLGYRRHPHLATEVQMEYVFGLDAEVEYGGASREALRFSALTTTANAKVPVLTGRIQPFVVAGLGFMYGKIEDSIGMNFTASDVAFAVRGGGGFDVVVSRNIVLSAETTYVFPIDPLRHLDYLSAGVGLQYRF